MDSSSKHSAAMDDTPALEKLHCSFCPSQYTNRHSLLNHVRNKHPNMHVERPVKESRGTEKCRLCGSFFSNKSNLYRHYRNTHEKVQDEGGYVFRCKLCDYATKRPDHFKVHERRHTERTVQEKDVAPVRCNLCSFESSREMVIEHFQGVHGILVHYEKHEFDDIDAFNVWKADVEKDCSSNFSCQSHYRTKDGSMKMSYRCHRDGVYRPRGDNVRQVKSSGSNKIGGCCPASMHVTIHPQDCVTVTFCPTHVGHQGDVKRMRLSTKERVEIARKISAGVSFERILEEDSPNCRVVLTKKDLHNIARDFNLEKGGRDVTASLVREMQTHNIVRFFKPKGERSLEYPQLAENDSIITIMTAEQITLFRQFASNVVCIDDTYDSTGYRLTSILLLDEMGEGLPGAFMLSTRTDPDIVGIFVDSIRQAVGAKTKPRVLLSSMANVASWTRHMLMPETVYGWHVDYELRKNLVLKVDESKQGEVYEMITALLDVDGDEFDAMLHAAVRDMKSNPQTWKFADYFLTYFGNHPERWAPTSAELNAKITLNNFHETLKRAYVNNKKPKRLDIAVHSLMRILRDKLFDRLTSAQLTAKLLATRERHETSLLSDAAVVKKNGHFHIVTDTGKYDVVRTDKQGCQCPVRCDECNACVHLFECTCPDSTYEFNFCEHSHLVCRELDADALACLGDDFEVFTPDSQVDHVLSALDETEQQEIENEKCRLLNEFSDIVSSLESLDDLRLVEKKLKFLLPALKSKRKSSLKILSSDSKKTRLEFDL